MRTRLSQLGEQIRASLWFVPSVMAVLAIGLAIGLVQLDRLLGPRDNTLPWVFSGGPAGALSLLSAITASLITVIALVFSITIVTLTLSAQQWTPLVIRQFVRDQGNHVVLGGFIGTFLYSLMVLRTIRSVDADTFVPQIAVNGAGLLTIFSLGLLIFFIHHTAAAIQPTGIVALVARDTHRLIARLFPERLGYGEADPQEDLPEAPGEGAAVPAKRSGYLQSVDSRALMAIARKEDLVLRVEHAVGEFVLAGSRIVTLWPPERANALLDRRINTAFAFGRNRTLQQDPEFGVIQIVAIAVKALSPSINDPSTARICLHVLSDILHHLGGCKIPARIHRDRDGRPRIIARGTDFQRMVSLAFTEIRQYGEGSISVLLGILEAIIAIAAAVPNEERRSVLRRHVALVTAAAERGLTEPADQEPVNERARAALHALAGDTPAYSGE